MSPDNPKSSLDRRRAYELLERLDVAAELGESGDGIRLTTRANHKRLAVQLGLDQVEKIVELLELLRRIRTEETSSAGWGPPRPAGKPPKLRTPKPDAGDE